MMDSCGVYRVPPVQDVPCRECALCKLLGYSLETDLQHAWHGDFTLPDGYWDPTPDDLAMQDFDRLRATLQL